MHIPAAFLVAIAIGAPFISALQNIYIGGINVCPYGPDWYAWFIDADPCTTGVSGGQANGPGLCSGTYTIQGHTGITFTNCTSIDQAPYGVFDGGAPALTCNPMSMPDQSCVNPCGASNPNVTVTTSYQCS